MKVFFGLLAAIASVGAVPASGQSYDFPLTPPRVENDTSRDSDRILARFADCLTRDRAVMKRTESALVLFPGSDKWHKAFAKLRNETCATKLVRADEMVSMRMSELVLTGALYGAMFRARFAEIPASTIAAAPTLDVDREFPDAPRGKIINGRPEMMMDWRVHQRPVADCAVRAEPEAARQMILNGPWSAAEDVAAPKLVGALRQCISNDESVRLNRALLRGIIAEALFKLAEASSLAVTPHTVTAGAL